VEMIDTGRPDVSSLTAAQGRTLRTALEPSEAAIGARSGGVGIDKDIEPVEACLGEVGYLPS